MRLLIAALVLTLAVAVTAAIFAIWPVVADAPWEASEPVIAEERSNDTIRCDAALRLRETILSGGWGGPGRISRKMYEESLALAEQEIARFC